MIGHKEGVTTSLSTFSAPVGVQEMSLSTQQSLSSAQFQMTLREVPPVTTWLSSGRHLLATGRTLPKCHFM